MSLHMHVEEEIASLEQTHLIANIHSLTHDLKLPIPGRGFLNPIKTGIRLYLPSNKNQFFSSLGDSKIWDSTVLKSFEMIFSTGCYLGSRVATPRGPTKLLSTTSRAFHACSGLNISGACNKQRSIANQSKYGPFLLCIKFPRP